MPHRARRVGCTGRRASQSAATLNTPPQVGRRNRRWTSASSESVTVRNRDETDIETERMNRLCDSILNGEHISPVVLLSPAIPRFRFQSSSPSFSSSETSAHLVNQSEEIIQQDTSHSSAGESSSASLNSSSLPNETSAVDLMTQDPVPEEQDLTFASVGSPSASLNSSSLPAETSDMTSTTQDSNAVSFSNRSSDNFSTPSSQRESSDSLPAETIVIDLLTQDSMTTAEIYNAPSSEHETSALISELHTIANDITNILSEYRNVVNSDVIPVAGNNARPRRRILVTGTPEAIIDLSNVPTPMPSHRAINRRNNNWNMRQANIEDDDVVFVSSNGVYADGQEPRIHVRPFPLAEASNEDVSVVSVETIPPAGKSSSSSAECVGDASSGGRSGGRSGASSAYICPVCMEPPVNNYPTSTKCGHVFCRQCIQTAVQTTHKCPICNKRLTLNNLLRIYL